MKSKKDKIEQQLLNNPFKAVDIIAEELETTRAYVYEVARERGIDLNTEKAIAYLDMLNKYEKLSHEYTDLVVDKAIAEEQPGKLQELFDLQKAMQARVNNDKLPQMQPERIPMTVTSIVGELGEILEEQQAWKDWKENPEKPDMENLRMEVADVWHFVINLTLYLGMDAEDLYQEFVDKNKVNHERQDNNY